MGGFCLGLMRDEDQLVNAVQKWFEWDLILSPILAPSFCLLIATESSRPSADLPAGESQPGPLQCRSIILKTFPRASALRVLPACWQLTIPRAVPSHLWRRLDHSQTGFANSSLCKSFQCGSFPCMSLQKEGIRLQRIDEKPPHPWWGTGEIHPGLFILGMSGKLM